MAGADDQGVKELCMIMLYSTFDVKPPNAPRRAAIRDVARSSQECFLLAMPVAPAAAAGGGGRGPAGTGGRSFSCGRRAAQPLACFGSGGLLGRPLLLCCCCCCGGCAGAGALFAAGAGAGFAAGAGFGCAACCGAACGCGGAAGGGWRTQP